MENNHDVTGPSYLTFFLMSIDSPVYLVVDSLIKRKKNWRWEESKKTIKGVYL